MKSEDVVGHAQTGHAPCVPTLCHPVEPRSLNPFSLRLILVGLLLCSAAPSSFAQKVDGRAEAGADFSAYKTFEFEQAARSRSDPFFDHPEAEQWVRQALVEELSSAGCQQAVTGDPDFLIRISGRSELKEREVDTGRVYVSYVEQYLEAVLTVEFIDAASDKTVWTATATDRVDIQRDGPDITEDKAQRRIRKAVRKMVQLFRKAARRPAKG